MNAAAHTSAPLARLSPLLTRWIGLDTATVGTAAIDRACRLRMEKVGIDSLAAYIDRVADDLTERGELIEHVVVGESWFFRDPQVFEFLRHFVRGRLARSGQRPIRILSAPCAGGEEPYSVAMALFDAGLTAGQFVIDAIDISRVALQRARAGRYSVNAFRNADLSFRDRWFQLDGGTAVIDPRIREQVRLIEGNLLDDDCLAQLEANGPYDVVFCRNLLIYLDEPSRTAMERTFDRLLAKDGLLVLGAAEPPILKGRWSAAAATSIFALERASAEPRPAAAAGSGRAAAPPGSRPPRRPPRNPRPATGAAAPPPPAAEPADPGPAPAAAPITVDAVLREAGDLANAGRFADAIAVCGAYHERSGPAAEVFFLMGMLHQSAGDLDRAEACLHKTLYLDGAHADAFLALALIATQRGDSTMAEKYRQSAVRVAARGGNA